jgi:hypothetical protein
MRADDGRGDRVAVANRRGRFEMAKSWYSLRQEEDAAQQASFLIVIIDIGREGTVAGQAIVARSRRTGFGVWRPMMVMVRGRNDLDHQVNGQCDDANRG